MTQAKKGDKMTKQIKIGCFRVVYGDHCLGEFKNFKEAEKNLLKNQMSSRLSIEKLNFSNYKWETVNSK